MKKSRITNRIIRSSLSEQAAQHIKSWILSLRLKPDERLIVDNLAEEFAISRTPIREGLQKLVAEGFVVYDGKSYTVMRYSREDIENLFEIRCALEVLAARQASVRRSDALLEALWSWYETWRTQQQENNIEFFISQDRRFHQLICQGAGNLKLQTLLDNLNEQCWWVIRLIYVPRLPAYKKHFSMEEHLAILNHIKNCDAEGAAHAMEKHLHRSELEMMQYVE